MFVNVLGALVGGQCVNRVSIDCLIAQGWMLSSSSTGTFTRWRDRSPPKQLLKVNDAQVSDVQIEHGAQAGEVDLRTAMLELAGFKRQVLPTSPRSQDAVRPVFSKSLRQSLRFGKLQVIPVAEHFDHRQLLHLVSSALIINILSPFGENMKRRLNYVAYQIIVADAADAVSVNFSGRCKFFFRFNAKIWQFTVYFAVITQKIGNLLCILS